MLDVAIDNYSNIGWMYVKAMDKIVPEFFTDCAFFWSKIGIESIVSTVN
jgi:hypothetical protein